MAVGIPREVMEIYAIWVRDDVDGIWLHSALDASSVEKGFRDDFDRALEDVCHDHGSANVRAQMILLQDESVRELFNIPMVALDPMEDRARRIIDGLPNQKIQAIKEVRELTGKGLKEAKDLVDRYRATGKMEL